MFFSFDNLKGENEINYIQNVIELSLSTLINFDSEIKRLNVKEQNKKIEKKNPKQTMFFFKRKKKNY